MNNVTKIAAALALAGLLSSSAFAADSDTTPTTTPATTPTPSAATFKLDDVKVNTGLGYVHYTGDLAKSGTGYTLTNAAFVATAPATTETSNVGTLSTNGKMTFLSFTRFNDESGKCYADVKMSVTGISDTTFKLSPLAPLTKLCDAAVPVNQGDSLDIVKLRAQIAELERLLKQLKLDKQGHCTADASVGPDGVVVGTDGVKLNGGDDNPVSLGDMPTWMQDKVNGQNNKVPSPMNPFNK